MRESTASWLEFASSTGQLAQTRSERVFHASFRGQIASFQGLVTSVHVPQSQALLHVLPNEHTLPNVRVRVAPADAAALLPILASWRRGLVVRFLASYQRLGGPLRFHELRLVEPQGQRPVVAPDGSLIQVIREDLPWARMIRHCGVAAQLTPFRVFQRTWLMAHVTWHGVVHAVSPLHLILAAPGIAGPDARLFCVRVPLLSSPAAAPDALRVGAYVRFSARLLSPSSAWYPAVALVTAIASVPPPSSAITPVDMSRSERPTVLSADVSDDEQSYDDGDRDAADEERRSVVHVPRIETQDNEPKHNDDDDNDDDACGICYAAPGSVFLQPCRHGKFCAACFARLDRCPLCRIGIDGADHLIAS